MNTKRVTLVETTTHHIDVLLSVAESFVANGFKTSIVLRKSLQDTEILSEVFRQAEVDYYKGTLSLLRKLLRYRRFPIIFNTCESFRAIVAALVLTYSARIGRIVHNVDVTFQARKIRRNIVAHLMWSMVLGLLNVRIKANLVLGEALVAEATRLSRKPIRNYCPVIWSRAAMAAKVTRPHWGNDGRVKLRLGVQGNIEFSRRNYLGMLESIRTFDPKLLDGCEIHIIGNSAGTEGGYFKERTKELGLTNIVRISDGYIPFEHFFRLVSSMHFLLLLVDRTVPSYERYNTVTISSTYHVCLTHSIPMITSADVPWPEQMRPITIAYQADRVEEGIRDAAKLTPQLYQEMVHSVQRLTLTDQSEQWSELRGFYDDIGPQRWQRSQKL